MTMLKYTKVLNGNQVTKKNIDFFIIPKKSPFTRNTIFFLLFFVFKRKKIDKDQKFILILTTLFLYISFLFVSYVSKKVTGWSQKLIRF